MLLAFLLTLLYVGLVYLRPQEYVDALKEVPILPTLLTAAALVWLPARNKDLSAPQHWFVPLFTLSIFLSLALRGWFGGAFKELGTFLPIVALWYLVSTTTVTVARHRLFMMMIGAATTVLAVHGLDQASNGTRQGWSGAWLSQGTRITYLGIFYDPNDLALAFVMAIPMILYLVKRAGFLGKLAWLGALLTIYYGIYLTNSRGGMLAAMAQLFVVMVRRFGIAAGAIGAAAGAGAMLALPSRLEQLDAGEASAQGRVHAWYAGLQMLFGSPLIGVGKNNFTDIHLLTAHNSWVLAFAELGLLGYFFWMSTLALSFYMVYRIASAPPPEAAPEGPEARETREIALAYCYSMLGFFVGAFFLSRTYNILLFLLCGLCVALYATRRALPGGWEEVAFRPLAGKLAMVTVGSVVALWAVVRTLLALGAK